MLGQTIRRRSTCTSWRLAAHYVQSLAAVSATPTTPAFG